MHDFVDLTVAATAHEAADTLVVTFDVPAHQSAAFQFKPGQHLAFRATIEGADVRRTYSICSGPGEALAVGIKRVPGGLFSGWAHATLKPGATLEAMPPQGRFLLPEQPGPKGHVVAFAAGSGITPIIAMIAHAMHQQSETRFTLVYGNRDTDSIIFRQRLEDLKDAFVGRLAVAHVLSRNEESGTPLLEGRIGADKVEAFARHVLRIDDIDAAFLCGPGTMIKDVRTALMALGLPRERIHHEFFAAAGGTARPTAAPPLRVDPSATGGSEIVAVLDGTRHRFFALPNETIVDAALRAGLRAPYACKGGMCSTCRARLVEGTAPMTVNYSLEPWELEKNFVLTCQAIPHSPRVVVDFDQM